MKGLHYRQHLAPVYDDEDAPLPLYARGRGCAECRRVKRNMVWAVPAGIMLVGGISLAVGYSWGKRNAPRQQTVHTVG